MKPLLPQQCCLSRDEFRATIRDLSFHDTYATYTAGVEAGWVMLLSTQELQTFSKEVRLELLRCQVRLGRGQIYNLAEYEHMLKESELEQAQVYTFKYEGQTMLELNHTLWHSFSFETQKRWLERVMHL